MKAVSFVTMATILSAAADVAAGEDSVSFAGKTVVMTIGNAAGGGTDLYGRALGRWLVGNLPGQPGLVVINQPGAGGVVALNSWAVRAKPDGTAITLGAGSQVDPVALIQTQAKYDPRTFKFVGGLASPSQVLFIDKASADRLYDASRAPPIMGIVGSTPRAGMFQALWGVEFLGWNLKWVHGYSDSSTLRQALEQGEIDMTSFGTIEDIRYLLASGKFAVLSQTGAANGGNRLPLSILGDAPLFGDLVRGKIQNPMAQKAYDLWDTFSQAGVWLALPPKTPDRIVAIYVEAFDKAVQDPRYQAAASAVKVTPDTPLVSGPELKKLVEKLAAVSPGVLDYFQSQLSAFR
jgi:tripartite-type tricarboxylate transporter receptor subunit TctC